MGLVTLAALCVAGFAILFRLFERYEVPMLPAIAINYAVAFVCGMIVAPPSPATSSGSLLLAAAGLGALFVSIWNGWPMVPRWSPSQAPTAAASPR